MKKNDLPLTIGFVICAFLSGLFAGVVLTDSDVDSDAIQAHSNGFPEPAGIAEQFSDFLVTESVYLRCEQYGQIFLFDYGNMRYRSFELLTDNELIANDSGYVDRIELARVALGLKEPETYILSDGTRWQMPNSGSPIQRLTESEITLKILGGELVINRQNGQVIRKNTKGFGNGENLGACIRIDRADAIAQVTRMAARKQQLLTQLKENQTF